MILITDTTGFIGRDVVRRLGQDGRKLRCLLRPSRVEQQLPPGVSCSIVSASMDDLPALRTAMQGITTILHLMGEDDPNPSALYTHARETANLIQAARETDVRRFIYLSRLEADRTSAFALFRARGEAEASLRESGLAYTILQAAITYGPGDGFTTVLAMLARTIPYALPIPDASHSRFQPLWVGDLTRCIVDTLDRDELIGQTVPLGGPEHYTLEQLVTQVLLAAGVQRRLVPVSGSVLRLALWKLDVLLPHSPTPRRWLDVVALGSATDLGTIPHYFGFEPERFADRIGYLRHIPAGWRDLVRLAFTRH